MKVLLLYLLSINVILKAQVVSGIVTHAVTNLPLKNVTVYINQSQIATQTNAEGFYTLTLPNLPSVSMVFTLKNFSTTIQNYKKPYQNITANIKLTPIDKTEEDIVIKAAIKDGWAKWGKFFLKNFFGETEHGLACNLKNYKALKFYIDKPSNTLSVFAYEPLEIVNPALGYKIIYELTKFNYNLKTNLMYVEGLSQYTSTTTTKSQRKQRKINNIRIAAYQGGIVHFMKSLYNNTLKQNNYYVVFSKIVEKEVQDVVVNQSYLFKNNTGNNLPTIKRKKKVEILDTVQLSLKQLLMRTDTVNSEIVKTISFPNRLFIIYEAEYESQTYANSQMRAAGKQQTRIYFAEGANSFVLSKYGLYYNSEEVILDGYMGYEKLGEQLPIDFEVE